MATVESLAVLVVCRQLQTLQPPHLQDLASSLLPPQPQMRHVGIQVEEVGRESPLLNCSPHLQPPLLALYLLIANITPQQRWLLYGAGHPNNVRHGTWRKVLTSS